MSRDNRYALDSCIKCSICVTQCPVARVTDKFAGPKQNGPDLERFRLEEPAAVHPSIGYCSNCKGCDVACPSGVNVSAMNSRAKEEYVALHGAPLRDKLLCRVELMGKTARLAPSVVNLLSGIKPLRVLGERLIGVSAEMTMPRYASKTFLELYKPKLHSEQKVVYYPGCYVNYNTPEVGLALADVLAHNNIEMIIDRFDCCGLPILANGFLETAREYAHRNLAKLQSYAARGYRIITTCPSCNLTLRREYQELFDLETNQLNEHIMDAFEYLETLNQQGRLDTNFKKLPLWLGYHQPCHLKASGLGVTSLAILRLIPELQVQDLDAGCCGLSGSYGFKKEKYPISQEIGRNIRRSVEASGVKQVISECGMCQLQITHLTGTKVYHPIQLIAEAYGAGSL